MTDLLDIEDLSVHFESDDGSIEAVDHVSFNIRPGEIVGLVGESGSGKSVTALAILRLIQRPGHVKSGTVRFEGVDLRTLDEDGMRRVRGARISLVPQSPRTSLNPVITVGRQISRLLELHEGLSGRAARKRMLEMLDLVHIPDPERRAKQYAHQLSGGMCQRILIAMALSTSPRLLIADEPTTGLDVSIAARIVDLLRELSAKTGAAVLIITHDLGVVAQICDRVVVMHAGQAVESAAVRALFHNPKHPYTQALINSIPRLDTDVKMQPIAGAVPSLLNPKPGCRYVQRCSKALPRCREERPKLLSRGVGQLVACHAVPVAACP